MRCHNARLKTANLLLDKFDLSDVSSHAEIAEKVVRKLRAGVMPPMDVPRPGRAAREGLVAWLEGQLDRQARPHLSPPGLHRLNRTEYTNVIRDLLDLRVDARQFLPTDDSTNGFDNQAGTLTVSPALIEAYLSAASKISRLAIGSVNAPSMVQFTVPEDATQNYHVEGLPFRTRGGLLVKHEFPADGEYVIKVTPINKGNMSGRETFGEMLGEKLEVLVDGALVQVFDWDKTFAGVNDVRTGLETARIPIKAGEHSVGVTFIATNYPPDHNVQNLFSRTTIETGGLAGLAFFPHIGLVRIEGPFNATGAAEVPSRRKILVCQPARLVEEEPCARRIVSTLARRALRRPVQPGDVNKLIDFYRLGRKDGGSFDRGIEAALERLLADPEFIYRAESGPTDLPEGKAYRISDLALASRLSFFLWSSIPDDELLSLAAQGKLRQAAVLEAQVRRMLADPRSAALVTNFTGQWLNVRGLQNSRPAAMVYPDFDDNLRQSFRQEVELFFGSIVQENRSVLELLTADYTFVDERLARHYGIRNVYGSRFRRVPLGPELDIRRGLLGKGALMTVTSQAVRTSPVTRGKWFLQTFLGVTPPDPPPDVPAIKEKEQDLTGNSKEPTMREMMERHRRNPVCATCHKIFEPIGLALENFDGIASWRTQEAGGPIDPSGVFVDGSTIDGPVSLRELLLRYSPAYVQTVTERLLTYALGRGVEYEDMPLVRAIVRDAATSDYRFASLVMGVVKSAPFQMNEKIRE